MRARKGAQPSTSFTASRPRTASACPRGSSPGSMSAWPTISPAPPAMTRMDSSTGPCAAMKSSNPPSMPSRAHSALMAPICTPLFTSRNSVPRPPVRPRAKVTMVTVRLLVAMPDATELGGATDRMSSVHMRPCAT
uniref:Orf135 protein n=1 Tax=Myxococcus xanthus TaxID=34 RepID=Q7WTM4_MYXXA|nr:orf135 [Myxococcus xanthus DZF1]